MTPTEERAWWEFFLAIERRACSELTEVAKSLFVRQYSDPLIQTFPPWPLSDGEIHFLYSFIQGSIMIPETRRALHRAWGFCERHAWGALAVQMCFRSTFLLGPAILYEDLMERCLANLPGTGPFRAHRLARRLRSYGPCLMCETNAYRAGRGGAPEKVIERGRQTDMLCQFALDHLEHWEDTVCGLCRGDSSEVRCRRHLIERPDLLKCRSIERHFAMLADVRDRVRVFKRSFMWENRGIDGPRERAALLSAIGWMSGWRPLLLLVDEAREARVA